ncbi:hypothetical protein DPX16_4854 [Anabarilius grahami]|uniref:Uncharacterized protein n=1 Tax=Anabarilius grahami TaxID=495550 RepID=A0A3N0Y240_ANAGA|nr:hypothetical protein DPX16_4854 [Anabarilius grahami]
MITSCVEHHSSARRAFVVKKYMNILDDMEPRRKRQIRGTAAPRALTSSREDQESRTDCVPDMKDSGWV